MRWRRGPQLVHLVDDEELRGTLATDGRLLGITGAGGAPGRTFLSLNVAMALAMDGLSVGLVEAGPGLGTVSVQLDLRESRSLPYLIHENAVTNLDDDLLNRHLQQSGPLDVLTGRFDADQSAALAPELFDQVTNLLAQRHRLVVVDLGPMDSPLTVSLALRCQMICWVVAPTPVGVDLFDRVIRSGIVQPLRTKPSVAVLNGSGDGTLPAGEDALLRRYGISVAAAIPFNRPASLRAESSGRPAVLGGQLRAPLRQAARALASAALKPISQPKVELGADDTGASVFAAIGAET
ncbi:MAG: AAA family ATPase [Candidatus Dormibacteria bacterium]